MFSIVEFKRASTSLQCHSKSIIIIIRLSAGALRMRLMNDVWEDGIREGTNSNTNCKEVDVHVAS